MSNNPNTSKYETLIFDLGNVIIDLDYDTMLNGFANASNISSNKGIMDFLSIHPVCFEYEKGRLESNEFFEVASKEMGLEMDFSTFQSIWNGLLCPIDSRKLDLLVKLRKQQPILLLSNTNEMHQLTFDQMTAKIKNVNTLAELVDDVCYSHWVGMRKPDPEIFEHLCAKHDLNPSSCLFLDDNLQNIEAAKQFGLNTIPITKKHQVLEIFADEQ